MIQTASTANDIINAVASEVGLTPVIDPFASTDTNFLQLQGLLNACIKQLVRKYPWEELVQEHRIITLNGTTEYPMPEGYLRMVDQTAWDNNNESPMRSISAQQWGYLKSKKLSSQIIPINYRVKNGMFALEPSVNTASLDITFEYITSFAVVDSATNTRVAIVKTGADVPVLDSFMLERFLKVKWYEAKGFDTSAAQDDLNEVYANLTNSNEPSPVLNAGGVSGLALLTGNSVGDTNYGNP